MSRKTICIILKPDNAAMKSITSGPKARDYELVLAELGLGSIFRLGSMKD